MAPFETARWLVASMFACCRLEPAAVDYGVGVAPSVKATVIHCITCSRRSPATSRLAYYERKSNAWTWLDSCKYFRFCPFFLFAFTIPGVSVTLRRHSMAEFRPMAFFLGYNFFFTQGQLWRGFARGCPRRRLPPTTCHPNQPRQTHCSGLAYTYLHTISLLNTISYFTFIITFLSPATRFWLKCAPWLNYIIYRFIKLIVVGKKNCWFYAVSYGHVCSFACVPVFDSIT